MVGDVHLVHWHNHVRNCLRNGSIIKNRFGLVYGLKVTRKVAFFSLDTSDQIDLYSSIRSFNQLP